MIRDTVKAVCGTSSTTIWKSIYQQANQIIANEILMKNSKNIQKLSNQDTRKSSEREFHFMKTAMQETRNWKHQNDEKYILDSQNWVTTLWEFHWIPLKNSTIFDCQEISMIGMSDTIPASNPIALTDVVI